MSSSSTTTTTTTTTTIAATLHIINRLQPKRPKMPKFDFILSAKTPAVTMLSRLMFYGCAMVLLSCVGIISAERDFNINESQVPVLEPKDEPHHIKYKLPEDPYAIEMSRCDYADSEILLTLVLKQHDFNDSRRAKVLNKLSKFFAIPKEFIVMESAKKYELSEMQKSAIRKGENKCHSSKRRLGRVNFMIGCGTTYFKMGEPIANQIGAQMRDGTIDSLTGAKFGWWVIWHKDAVVRSERLRRQAAEGSGDDYEYDDDYDYEDETPDEAITTTTTAETHTHRHHHGSSAEVQPERTDNTLELLSPHASDDNDDDNDDDEKSSKANIDPIDPVAPITITNNNNNAFDNANIDEDIVQSVSQLESVITKTIENTKNLKELSGLEEDLPHVNVPTVAEIEKELDLEFNNELAAQKTHATAVDTADSTSSTTAGNIEMPARENGDDVAKSVTIPLNRNLDFDEDGTEDDDNDDDDDDDDVYVENKLDVDIVENRASSSPSASLNAAESTSMATATATVGLDRFPINTNAAAGIDDDDQDDVDDDVEVIDAAAAATINAFTTATMHSAATTTTTTTTSIPLATSQASQFPASETHLHTHSPNSALSSSSLSPGTFILTATSTTTTSNAQQSVSTPLPPTQSQSPAQSSQLPSSSSSSSSSANDSDSELEFESVSSLSSPSSSYSVSSTISLLGTTTSTTTSSPPSPYDPSTMQSGEGHQSKHQYNEVTPQIADDDGISSTTTTTTMATTKIFTENMNNVETSAAAAAGTATATATTNTRFAYEYDGNELSAATVVENNNSNRIESQTATTTTTAMTPLYAPAATLMPPAQHDIIQITDIQSGEKNATDEATVPPSAVNQDSNSKASNEIPDSVSSNSTVSSLGVGESSGSSTPDSIATDYVEPTKVENTPPIIKSRLQKIAITSGKSFRFTIPTETFFDNEDNTNLRLVLTEKEGRELKPSSWLQFNAETRELYGLPLDDTVSKYQYLLSATDSGNESVTEAVEITVQQHHSIRSVNHEISVAVKINDKQMYNIDWQVKLIQAIATTLGDDSTDAIVVREVRQTPQDPGTAIFVYFNETLPTVSCPETELNNLVKDLDAKRLSDLVNPTLGIKSITGQLIGSCQKTHSTKAKTPTLTMKNSPPVPRNQVDRVNATVGHLLVFKVPSDTFYDANDNDLTLSLKTKDHKDIAATHWLRFDSKNQEFYGIAKSQDIGSEEFMLVAEDSGGLTATDALVVVVGHSQKRDFAVYFKAYLAIRPEHFDAQLQRKFVERIADLSGDQTAQLVQIRSISPDHDSDGLVVTFYNTTLYKAQNRCPDEQIDAVRSVYLMQDHMLRDRVKKVLGSELGLTNLKVLTTGTCDLKMDINHRENIPTPTETEPTLKSSFAHDYMYTVILPAVIIVTMIVIASIIACCLHRRRRKSGKMELGDEEERKAFRKGIPVIFQDELDEKPEIGNKSPIILKDEKPPLLPPSYNTSNMNGDTDVDEYVPPPAVVVGGREARGKSPATPSYRKPPPYVSP